MLIAGLIVAAILGPLYVRWKFDSPPLARYGIASAVAVLGASISPFLFTPFLVFPVHT